MSIQPEQRTDYDSSVVLTLTPDPPPCFIRESSQVNDTTLRQIGIWDGLEAISRSKAGSILIRKLSNNFANKYLYE
jgi:hypothetical protein